MLGQTPPRGNSDIIVPGEGGPDLGGQSLQGCKLEERRHPGGGGGRKEFLPLPTSSQYSHWPHSDISDRPHMTLVS